eukprot:21328-Heterococcus_DN1.PRE.4
MRFKIADRLSSPLDQTIESYKQDMLLHALEHVALDTLSTGLEQLGQQYKGNNTERAMQLIACVSGAVVSDIVVASMSAAAVLVPYA